MFNFLKNLSGNNEQATVSPKKQPKGSPVSELRLKVKPATYFSAFPEEAKSSFITREDIPRLPSILVLDSGDKYTNCTPNTLAELGKTEPEAFAEAIKNSKSIPYELNKLEVDKGIAVNHLFSEASLAAIHAIEPDEEMFGDMGFAFIVPSEEELLWAGVSESDYEKKLMTLGQIVEVRTQEVAKPLSESIYLYKPTGEYVEYGKS